MVDVVVYLQFTFGNSTYSSISSDLSTFNAGVLAATQAIVGVVSPGNVNIVTNQTGSNLILTTIYFPDPIYIGDVAASISLGQYQVQFNSAKYVAYFSANAGPCPDGTVSATGTQPGCTTCRANTYVRSRALKSVPIRLVLTKLFDPV
jgi:hypothetical protein